MAEYIELTEELKLSMCAGARAILNTKKYHGSIYISDVFSDNPKEIPYLKAAEILYTASEKEPADVVPVLHGRWEVYMYGKELMCSSCKTTFWDEEQVGGSNYCPNCGARMNNA